MTPPKKVIVTEHHAAKDLLIHPRAQRDLLPSRVTNIAAGFHPASIGVVTVSKHREDGANPKLYVIDGQHRIAALLHMGLDDFVVTCNVHMGLDLAEEAWLFRNLNNTRRTMAFDDFDKGVLAGDPECLAITKTLDKFGLRLVQNNMSDGTVRAVAALRHVHRYGEGSLDKALEVLTNAYGLDADAMDGMVIQGVGMLVSRYNGDLDRAVMVKKLAKRPGGPPKLIGDAKGLRNALGGSVPKCVALVCRETYNRGRNTGQLPPL